MATFEVKAESLPERCEICHQADLFNRETGYCARCSPLATQAAAPPPPTQWQPQPFTPAPPAVPHPFAPPQPFPYPPPVPQPFSYPPPMQYGAPQPYPYQPPVSPLAPTLPRVVHEDPTYWARQHQPLPRLHYRYVGPTTVSEWISFRDAALGGLVGALPMMFGGAIFLLSTPWTFAGMVLEVLLASGFAGFLVGNRFRAATTRTEARHFREGGARDATFATFPLMGIPVLLMAANEMAKNLPDSFLILLAVFGSLVPYILAALALNLIGGYLAARNVEFLERHNLVATTTPD